MPKRIYIPSETHHALYPAQAMSTCVECGVRFVLRSTIPHLDSGDDDPEKCLSCNRRSWSRLFNNNQPVDNKGEGEGDVVSIKRSKTA